MKTLSQIFQEYDYKETTSVDISLEEDKSRVDIPEQEIQIDKTLYYILQEYNKIFKLNLQLKIDKEQFKDVNTYGFYSCSSKIVTLPTDKMLPNNLNSLFHEICHGIQDKENRLSKKAIESTLEDFLNCEIEAILFARKHTLQICPSFKDRHIAVYALAYIRNWKNSRLLC